MVYYLILCRSLTYAQRTAAVLERAGIFSHVMRSPKSITGEGCGHAVKIAERNLAPALQILRREELSPRQVFIAEPDGTYNEVFP